MVQAIIPLAEATDIQTVGGKASSLGQLIREGFNVPPGFVISTAAALLTTTKLEEQILRAFDTLQSPWVAVRSSGVNEDGTVAAWAGQLDTFLNVDRAHLLKSVQNCQKSAHSDRAMAYAKLQHLSAGTVAVVVQQMVQSEVSGVAFSIHPVIQNPNQLVIEAAYGLGEAVVSGEVTPDTYTLAKQSGKIIEKHLTLQTKQLVQRPDGTTTWQPIKGHGSEQKLPHAQLAELVKNVRKLETFFGFPVDIEWCFAHSQLYILQSRPITALS
jgi:phosphoenolpyruvate synthase/pyruvate phosphate dikinase